MAVGFALGALTFYLGSRALERRGTAENGSGIVLGAVLDGIPESIVLGLSLVGGQRVGAPFLVAVFISNLPEALGASADLLTSGMARGRVLAVWLAVVAASGLAAGVGYAAFSSAAAEVVASVETFAAGCHHRDAGGVDDAGSVPQGGQWPVVAKDPSCVVAHRNLASTLRTRPGAHPWGPRAMARLAVRRQGGSLGPWTEGTTVSALGSR